VPCSGASGGTTLPDDIRIATLANGLRVVTERVPGARSVTIGVWVGVGARDESAESSGASHYLEHLLFKGTEQRSARQIAQAVDAVGGEMNAYTAKEHTAYHVRLPASEVVLGLDLLADVLTAPAFRPDEVDAERQVILEELLLSEDDPDDRVHTLCEELLFPDHPLGREVLGTPDTIDAMGRDEIAAFFRHWYEPTNLVVAAAGDLDHDQVVQRVEAGFTGEATGARPERVRPSVAARSSGTIAKPTEQAHLAMGWRGCSLHDPARYPLAVLNHVLGGGLSSRLFYEIREKRGLCYSVGSYTSSFSDTGALVAAVGTSPSRLDEVRGLIEHEVERLLQDGITAEELTVAKGSLTGSLVLGLEDTASRMGRLGHSLITRGEVTHVDEHLARIEAVDLPGVQQVIGTVLGPAPSVALVGPLD
jgi:predicted Zn-dependent peptidase